MTGTAIVTGGSRGIGKAVAEELAKNGYNIVINGRNQKLLDKIARDISVKYSIKARGIAADVKKRAEVQKMIQESIKQFNKIDVLINNAGVLLVKDFEKVTEEEFDDVIDTNLKGVFLCSREILPHMISLKGGKIINISSGAGKSGFSKLSIYCASKFGVNGLTESLAQEVGQFGIDVIAICPGAVATGMQRKLMSDNEFKMRKDNMVQPSQVAKVVLDSIKGKFKTGSTVDVY